MIKRGNASAPGLQLADPRRDAVGLLGCWPPSRNDHFFDTRRWIPLTTTRRRIVVRGRVGAATAFALLLAELGLAASIAATLDEEDLDVVGQAVDEGDGAGGVGEDGVPVLEGQVGGDEQGAVLVTAADELEEEVGSPCVIRRGSRW